MQDFYHPLLSAPHPSFTRDSLSYSLFTSSQAPWSWFPRLFPWKRVCGSDCGAFLSVKDQHTTILRTIRTHGLPCVVKLIGGESSPLLYAFPWLCLYDSGRVQTPKTLSPPSLKIFTIWKSLENTYQFLFWEKLILRISVGNTASLIQHLPSMHGGRLHHVKQWQITVRTHQSAIH